MSVIFLFQMILEASGIVWRKVLIANRSSVFLNDEVSLSAESITLMRSLTSFSEYMSSMIE